MKVDLHCHSSASFDGSVDPAELVRLAGERGLTHLAVTDHDTIEGALAAQLAAPDGLTVIVGQEVRTREGDIIALFVEHEIPSRLSLETSVARVREQGGLIGLAHPFDVRRPSVGRGAVSRDQLGRLAELADYVEIHNGRITDSAVNARAADFARDHELPGVAVSDAHTAAEVGTAATALAGPLNAAEELRSALGGHVRLTVRARFDGPATGRVRRWVSARR